MKTPILLLLKGIDSAVGMARGLDSTKQDSELDP